MRSLDECRAEIFARSEKRIEKNRKFRRRMVAGLVPLCLCVILFAILPGINSTEKYECRQEPAENAEDSEHAPNADDPGNADCAEEQAFGHSGTETPPSAVAIVTANGESWMLPAGSTEQLALMLDDFPEDGATAGTTADADYEIEIPTADGKMIRYFLSGRQLACNGKSTELTESRLQQILELLQPKGE